MSAFTFKIWFLHKLIGQLKKNNYTKEKQIWKYKDNVNEHMYFLTPDHEYLCT